MKRLLIILSLLFTSATLFANCGKLGIQITNDTAHTCVFKNKLVRYGTLLEGAVPQTIASKTSTPVFYAEQDNVGVGVVLTYMCDGEIVKFYSWQQYCGFWTGAGEVGGVPYDASTLSLAYEKTMGSYLLRRPGLITWKVS